jgi:hypothetical protein
MKLFATRVSVLFAATLLFVPSEPRAADDASFKPLFNGKDFEGWRFSGQKDGDPWPENWKVKDGVIHLTGGGKPHLVTVREFADFEMRFEWRALQEKYNSGFYVRCAKDAGNNQLNLAKGSEGVVVGGKMEGSKSAAELQKPHGEWNAWRVLVKGDKISFWCNGKLAWEATGLKPDKGHIGLQAEGAAMEFRKLELREVK